MYNLALPLPPLPVLAQYHPKFALAIAMGVPVRPNVRVLQTTFSTTAANTFQPASFDDFISSYSVFGGMGVLVDPTSAFADNVWKTTSDANQRIVSGVSLTMTIRGLGDDYSPIPIATPLWLCQQVLNPTVGLWAMDNPQNAKATFTIFGDVPASPFTVWAAFAFYVLASSGEQYLMMTRETAVAKLRQLGLWTLPAQAAA